MTQFDADVRAEVIQGGTILVSRTESEAAARRVIAGLARAMEADVAWVSEVCSATLQQSAWAD